MIELRINLIASGWNIQYTVVELTFYTCSFRDKYWKREREEKSY